MHLFNCSMGGHGALVCFLKNPGLYKSVSAFAPICNPTECPWGTKAFTGYLGDQNKDAWKASYKVHKIFAVSEAFVCGRIEHKILGFRLSKISYT